MHGVQGVLNLFSHCERRRTHSPHSTRKKLKTPCTSCTSCSDWCRWELADRPTTASWWALAQLADIPPRSLENPTGPPGRSPLVGGTGTPSCPHLQVFIPRDSIGWRGGSRSRRACAASVPSAILLDGRYHLRLGGLVRAQTRATVRITQLRQAPLRSDRIIAWWGGWTGQRLWPRNSAELVPRCEPLASLGDFVPVRERPTRHC